MSISTEAPVDGLAALLRERTRVAHERAEGAGFVRDLLAGGLPIAAYAALAAQNLAIYEAMEPHGERWRGDPVAGPFVLDDLARVPRLRHDLAALLGPRWRARADELRVPATLRYAQRLHEVCSRWPAGFVAHHYVRYLGDLSGGQIIGQAVSRTYGPAGQSAVSFYAFDAIGKVKPFRDHYRRLLDAVPVHGAEREQMLAEAVVAFELNHAVFVDLSARYATPVPGGSVPGGSVHPGSAQGGEPAH